MHTVVENPRKISHEKSFEKENILRLKRYEEIKTAVCDLTIDEGMQALGFMDKQGFTQFKAAFYLACLAHKDQVDKGGMAYICHPVTVALHVRDHHPRSKKRDRAMTVALLHDVLEDTTVTEDMLKSFGFDKKVIRAVKLLTRTSEDTYDAYIDKLTVSRLAMKIKCADMTDNENLNRLKRPVTRDVSRSAFYHSRRLRIEECLREKKQGKQDHKGHKEKSQPDKKADK